MTPDLENIRSLLEKVKDPEIPVLTIQDLGILRDVQFENDRYIITITPTYVGCPAMNLIERYIQLCLDEEGIENYEIKTVLSPAWTTDWMTEEGKEKLKNYGIAPPVQQNRIRRLENGEGMIVCPRCKSKDTRVLSQFGATACKAQYQCNSCHEPFEYFKCH